ncbi:NAD(P)H-dependent oxidoreductase [Pacificimonas sp. WHA3]|uniref:FMN dependent NADH:quinone oxidoreductase n=1 Tax=Pacificimonas pallii TaxID=2827236 RepID=A0ABS6SGS1_9SPHN|nr:NAD(P)H-dependent oxidoreductase [Pacificimonas pallii]MBV7257607.1 NAD(P)H-dependent oxidoreductase [Pacificimonas pallii]
MNEKSPFANHSLRPYPTIFRNPNEEYHRMTTLLNVNASAQTEERSITRRLTQNFIDSFVSVCPAAQVVERDLGRCPPPFVNAKFIEAAFTPADDRAEWMIEKLSVSDHLIDEVIRSDVIVLGAPMYNYGMPAALKAWFDQIARIGRTFSFDLVRGDHPIRPMLSGKKLVVLSSRGEFGFEPGGIRASSNALDPAIAACAHYLGAEREEIETVAVEYQEFKDERHRRSLEAGLNQTVEIARRLATSA